MATKHQARQGLNLEVKQSQKLVMNPQMQQAIALLQLTNQQLTQMLAKEMEQNPFISFESHGGGGGGGKSAGQVIEETQTHTPSFQDYLAEQIRLNIKDEAIIAVGLSLTGWLDEDGYLRDPETEICAAHNLSPVQFHAVLEALQGLEPAGVFARDLSECLALQCKRAGLWDKHYETLLTHLDLLGKGDVEALAILCGVSVLRLREMIAIIRAYHPRPAALYEQEEVIIAAPDIIAVKEKGIWQAQLNEQTLPKVLVLEREWEAMAKRKTTEQERQFLKQNIGAAKWLRYAAQSRAATLLRVAQAIIAAQQNFLDKGMIALAPMTLRSIADATETHESTISRIVKAKLIATPHGVLPLRDLFSSGLNETSPKSVKAQIAKWIEQENRTSNATTLSDTQIALRLAQEGTPIARRTIAKYRAQLGIPPAHTRTRLARLD